MLMMSYNPPHMPFDQVPGEYVERYGDVSNADLLNRPNIKLEGRAEAAGVHVKNYFGMVTGVDEHFGRILSCLKEEGLEEDTIVVFTADHGEMMGSHGLMGKGVWYEESFPVPFIIRWPGKIASGEDDLLIGTPDLMPTLLGLMGFADHIPDEVEGSNYAGVFRGEAVERPSSGLYLDVSNGFPQGGRRGVRTHTHTFVIERGRDQADRLILHDNVADPYQMKNIAEESPELVKGLTEELHGWLEKTQDPWLTV